MAVMQSRIRRLGINGAALALSHSVFFSSVVMRTLATVSSDLDLSVEFLFKVSHFYSVCIWLSATHTISFLIWAISKKGLLNSVDLYHTFSKFSFGRVALGSLLLAVIWHYEVWMFQHIYKTYVVAFDWTIFKALIIVTPFFTLLLHTTLQLFFLSCGNCIRSSGETQHSYFKYYIVSSLFFNATMIVHVLCMGITSYSQGSMKDADTLPFIVICAIVEFGYRCYAIYIHFHLYGIHSRCSHQGGMAVPVSESVDVSDPDHSSPEMVVATRLPAAAPPYWIIPLIALSISSLGVAMAMDKTKINS